MWSNPVHPPTPAPEPPRFLRALRWPLTAALVAGIAALVVPATLADPGFLDANGGWLGGLDLVFAVLGLSAWAAPAPGAGTPRSRDVRRCASWTGRSHRT